MPASIDRLDAVGRIIDGLRATYPDAKKLSMDVRYEWQTPVDSDLDSELCPVVKIDIER
jgi:hypothetical protein